MKQRVEKMRRAMERKGVDVTIMTRPENIFYFSNFNPIIISHVPHFIITHDGAYLLVHSIRHDHAVNEGAADKVLCYGKWGAVRDSDTVLITEDGFEFLTNSPRDKIVIKG